jgi:hypothetical protein
VDKRGRKQESEMNDQRRVRGKGGKCKGEQWRERRRLGRKKEK